MTPISKSNDLALLILRLAFGGIMAYSHGYPKLMQLLGGGEIQFMNFLGLGTPTSLALAVFAEFVCALLIVLGAFTRLAAIPVMITMLVAVTMVHWNDPFGDKEFALLYFFAFAAIALAGAGWYSVDAQWRKVDGGKGDLKTK